MNYRQPSLPPAAPESVRESILEALQNDAFAIYQDGENFLRWNGFDTIKVIEDICLYIESGYRLYVLSGPTINGIKYQCCLNYGDIVIHVKFSNGSEQEPFCFIKLGFHEHNTGYSPLPY